MNQILFSYSSNKNQDISQVNSFSRWKKEKKKKIIYLTIFLSLLIIIFGIIIYIICHQWILHKKEKEANELLNAYHVATIYSSPSHYSAVQLSNNLSIIGLIEIPKINISYPILSQSTEESLKISVCRFSGPLPNHVGNMCIAGHNYKNTLMFSKIEELQLGDSIYISDINQNRIEYLVYNKYSTKENNLTCTQSSNQIEITLITCNKNNNNKRIVIKAKMRES